MRSVMIRIAGATIAASAVAHAGAWPVMKVSLSFSAVPDALAGSLAAGWFFGSAAMAVFGIAAYLVRELNPHFLGFVALGLLAGIPTLGVRRGGTGRT